MAEAFERFTFSGDEYVGPITDEAGNPHPTLVDAIHAGNDAATLAFLEEYKRVFCTAMIKAFIPLHNRPGALGWRPPRQDHLNECIHDLMTRAWNTLSKFDSSRGKFTTWIYGIAPNVRMEWVDRTFPSKETLSMSEDEVLRKVLGQAEGYEIPQTGKRYWILRECYQELPDKDKKVLWYRYTVETPYRDIPSDLGRTENARKQRALRARDKLKECASGKLG